MANLKQDILNNLGNRKYYIELELIRQAGDPNMVYQTKVEDMTAMLEEIASIDLATQLVGKYFPEQQPQANASVEEKADQPQTDDAPQSEAAQVHPGQTHGE